MYLYTKSCLDTFKFRQIFDICLWTEVVRDFNHCLILMKFLQGSAQQRAGYHLITVDTSNKILITSSMCLICVHCCICTILFVAFIVQKLDVHILDWKILLFKLLSRTFIHHMICLNIVNIQTDHVSHHYSLKIPAATRGESSSIPSSHGWDGRLWRHMRNEYHGRL
jgi:hypothetical protein